MATLQLRGTRTATTDGSVYKNVTTDAYTLLDFNAADYAGLIDAEKAGVQTDIEIGNGVCNNIDRIFTQPNGLPSSLDGVYIHDLMVTNSERGLGRVKNAKNILIQRVEVHQQDKKTTAFADAWATSDFPTDNIRIEDVAMYGFRMYVPEGDYPNGGAFSDEEKSTRHSYLRCLAADGNDGWDVKSIGAKVDLCVSRNNRRNWRGWGPDGVYTDCVSAFVASDYTKIDADGRTDMRPNAHFWFGSGRMNNCTLIRPRFGDAAGKTTNYLKIEGGAVGSVITVEDPMDLNGNIISESAFLARVTKTDTGKTNVTVKIRYTGKTPPVVNTTPRKPIITAQGGTVTPPPVVVNPGEPTAPITATTLTATGTSGISSATLAYKVEAGTDGATGVRVSRNGTDVAGKFPNGYTEDRALGDGQLVFRDLQPNTSYILKAVLLPTTLNKSVTLSVATTAPVVNTKAPNRIKVNGVWVDELNPKVLNFGVWVVDVHVNVDLVDEVAPEVVLPADIQALIIGHWSGDDLGVEGSTIDGWPSVDGGLTASQSDATKRPKVGTAPNGAKVAVFTNDFLTLPDAVRVGTAGINGLTSFVVADTDAVSTGSKVALYISTGTNPLQQRHTVRLTASANRWLFGYRMLDTDSAGEASSVGEAPAPGQMYVQTSIANHVTGDAALYINNRLLPENDTAKLGVISSTAAAGATIGARPDGSEPWGGTIRRIILCRTLTVAQRNRVLEFIASEDGLTIPGL